MGKPPEVISIPSTFVIGHLVEKAHVWNVCSRATLQPGASTVTNVSQKDMMDRQSEEDARKHLSHKYSDVPNHEAIKELESRLYVKGVR